MKIISRISGTVLVYTMVLVVIGVFMATVVLNIATELAIEYDTRNIEISLINTIQTKGDLAMKYGRELNDTGSGFVDLVGCPANVTMSGATARTTGITTDIHYLSGVIYCQGIHNGNTILFYFNSDFTDLQYAQYFGTQISVGTAQRTGTFPDPDATFLDINGSYPLIPDLIDDDFDSDNYTISSTGATLYPDDYIDDDADARLLNYGYITDGAGLYNVFWSNREMQEYIDVNPHNTDGVYKKLGDVTSGRLYMDINKGHRMILYRIDEAQYELSNELIIEERLTGTGQSAGIGYLQDDLSLSYTLTGNEYNFNFTNNDYAIFVENTGTGSLLYRIRGEETTTGSGIYLTAIQDDDPSIMSFLGSHMLIDDEGKLIGNQYEIFGLK